MKYLILFLGILIMLADQVASANDSTNITPNTQLTHADQRKPFILSTGTYWTRCHYSPPDSNHIYEEANCFGQRASTTFCPATYTPAFNISLHGYSATDKVSSTYSPYWVKFIIDTPRLDTRSDGYYLVFTDNPAGSGIRLYAISYWVHAQDARVELAYIIYCNPVP